MSGQIWVWHFKLNTTEHWKYAHFIWNIKLYCTSFMRYHFILHILYEISIFIAQFIWDIKLYCTSFMRYHFILHILYEISFYIAYFIWDIILYWTSFVRYQIIFILHILYETLDISLYCTVYIKYQFILHSIRHQVYIAYHCLVAKYNIDIPVTIIYVKGWSSYQHVLNGLVQTITLFNYLRSAIT